MQWGVVVCIRKVTLTKSEVGEVISAICLVGKPVIVLLLEMLVGAEFTEQGEQHVEGLDRRLIILKLVHGHIAHCANDLCIVGNVHINLRSREGCRLEGLLHLRVPLLH